MQRHIALVLRAVFIAGCMIVGVQWLGNPWGWIVGGAVGILLTGLRVAPSRGEEGATRIRASMAQHWRDEDHDFALVAATDYGHLDLPWYQETAESLAALGFSPLADYEDRTLTALNPEMKTFTRAMVDRAREIKSGHYHVRIRGPKALLLRLFRMPTSVKCLELISCFDDGGVMTTVRILPRLLLTAPEFVDRHVVALDTPATELLRQHQTRLETQRAAGRQPVVITTPEAMFAQANRVLRRTAEFHRNRDVSRAELTQMAGENRRLQQAAGDVADEFERDPRGDRRREP